MKTQSKFLSVCCKDRGATAIEYGLIAAGIAVAITAAVFALGGDVSRLFGGVGSTVSSETSLGRAATFGFDIGSPDGASWSGGTVVEVPGFGAVLRIDETNRNGPNGVGSESVTSTFEIAPNAQRALLEFDMTFADSWDGEQARIFVNGTDVGRINGNMRWTTPDVNLNGNENTQISAELTSSTTGTGTWGTTGGSVDHTYRVQIAVDDPGQEVSLGFGTTLNQNANDESLLIDNVSVSSE